VHQPLALAFLLAKRRRLEEAQQVLGNWAAGGVLSAETHAKLRALLDSPT
jgi:hypothetical protein